MLILFFTFNFSSFFFFKIEVQLICNLVLVSGVQQYDSAIHTYIYIYYFPDSFTLQIIIIIIILIYLWLCWVFVSVQGLSPVAASGGHSSSWCMGLSLSRPLLLRSTGSRRAGSVVVAHGPSCSAACGIFSDQSTNLCPLRWQADSQPLRHQGSPLQIIIRY